MIYSLLPFPTLSSRSADRPDIRGTLASREELQIENGISNLKLLDAIVEMLRELPWRFCVDHCHEKNGDLHLSLMAIDLGRELEKGDQLNAGFFIQNSESGKFETLACSRVFRVACENGALLECEKGQSFEISEGNKPPANWQTKIQEVVNYSFDSHGLDLDLARFRVTTEQMLVTPYEFLCHLSAQGLITDDEQSDIQAAFTESADFTMYGLINAVTRIAHGLRSSDSWPRAFEVERLGGEILRGDHNLPSLDPVYSR
jgi:hypothetical protein